MRHLLVLVLFVSLSCTPACRAQRSASASSNGNQTQDSSAVNASDGLADPSSTGDVNKTLDKMLAAPAQATSHDGSQAPKAAAAPPASTAVVPYAGAQNQLPAPLEPQPETALKGQARMDSSGTADSGCGNPLRGRQQDARPVLQGEAAINGLHMQADRQDDPDAGDQQLMIEWDRWRNRFLRAVQMQVQANINNPDGSYHRHRHFDPLTGGVALPFPLGTIAWFRCRITADRQIADLELVESSGFPEYDHAVISGIRALEGTSFLQFPAGSRRTSVHQEAGIETAAQPDYQYFRFGDVERYNVPAQGAGY